MLPPSIHSVPNTQRVFTTSHCAIIVKALVQRYEYFLKLNSISTNKKGNESHDPLPYEINSIKRGKFNPHPSLQLRAP